MKFVLGYAREMEFIANLVTIPAGALARAAARRLKRRPRRRGATLRPGLDTPLWLALAARVRPHLRARGNKSKLARELAVNPSRITEYFVRGTAMPDAERTLQILAVLLRGTRSLPARSR
ncbi:MAG TPA: hypothetical protein VGM73_12030 [Candidatus Didemnitutus sp.]|jgi:hypothetical protein